MKIIIIGAGWYGCHIAKKLQCNNEIIIIEQNNDIFVNNASYYNQNRLHLGFHYCRNFKTRQLCKNNYINFKNEYEETIDSIENNLYIIANNSIIDFQTFENIYKYEGYKFSTKLNNIFTNCYDNVIITDECVINSDKARAHFKDSLNNVKVILNSTVNSYSKDDHGKIYVHCNENNNKYDCDLLLDCTFNQLNLSTCKYKYELTLSLVYKLKQKIDFNAVTIVDGPFCSLYPRSINDRTYTLTDVEHTPIISSFNFEDIAKYQVEHSEVNSLKNKMEEKIKHYYCDFSNNFEYINYFLSKKTKLVSATDSREVNIHEIEKNVISVNCCKIYGIFEFEKYVFNYLAYANEKI